MPCFSCNYFSEGRGRNGESLIGGRGFCRMWDEIYSKYHDECRHYSPTWYASSKKGTGLGEPDSGCFLTGACVGYLGLPDDCKELTVLRAFRDNVLKASPEGVRLVEEYYAIAPALVEKINHSPNKDTIYQAIYERICQCIRAIEDGEKEKAIALYKEMVKETAESV